MKKSDLRQINEYLWEIPRVFDSRMNVPARVYASSQMLDDILQDNSLDQLICGAMLPGIVSCSIAMPDCHQGYSVPIGFVGATSVSDGVISPGACGFDINCGIRLLTSSYKYQDIAKYLDKLINQIYRQVPSGLGKGRKDSHGFSEKEIDQILNQGASYIVNSGLGEKDDLDKCENNGRLNWADAATVSKNAKSRGKNQVGTLGSGNHFLEIQRVDKIFDEKIASTFGLFPDQVTIMIHCGSRGLGHQVCSDYLSSLSLVQEKYNIKMPSREFVCAPFKSREGQRYFSAMAGAANYAWANRQMITHFIRQAWFRVLGFNNPSLSVLYDVAHNIIKKEKYFINDKEQEVLVHRKGATRAFPPNHPEIPDSYKQAGQPVLLPGSMGTSSYVLVGEETGKQSFYSTSHGAGRIMSRKKALKKFRGEDEIQKLEARGIIVKSSSKKGIAEEAPGVYKDIDDVVRIVAGAGLSYRVARLKPVAVIKGE